LFKEESNINNNLIKIILTIKEFSLRITTYLGFEKINKILRIEKFIFREEILFLE